MGEDIRYISFKKWWFYGTVVSITVATVVDLLVGDSLPGWFVGLVLESFVFGVWLSALTYEHDGVALP